MARELRFGIRRGENQYSTATYKVWVSGDSFYVARRGHGDFMKLSMHPTLRQVKVDRIQPDGGPSRLTLAPGEYDHEGKKRFARITLTNITLAENPAPDHKVTWVDLEGQQAVMFECWLLRMQIPPQAVHIVPPLEEVGWIAGPGPDDRIYVVAYPKTVEDAVLSVGGTEVIEALHRHADDRGRAVAAWAGPDGPEYVVIDSVLMKPDG